MILVISRGSHELTTDLVSDWVRRLGGDLVRLNAEDVWPGRYMSARLGASTGDDRIRIQDPAFDRQPIDIPVEDVRVVWYRRWTFFRRFLDDMDPIDDGSAGITGYAARRALRREIDAAGRALMSAFAHARWLSEPGTTDVDKVHALRVARDAGVSIPETLVTTSRAEVAAFLDSAPAGIITKNLAASPLSIDLADGTSLATYTEPVPAEALEGWPETFAASLFQHRIDKSYELRVFVLGDDLYAMAMFSQDDPKTATDFRRYQLRRPNRYVPYRLDDDLADRLRSLMRSLDLETGSIDLIRSPDGDTFFLEVNPVGQFGMVSQPCNYHLERRVAEYLIACDAA